MNLYVENQITNTPRLVPYSNGEKTSFEYNNQGQIVKIIGALFHNFPDNTYIFDEDLENTVTYVDNKIIVENNFYDLENPYTTEFILENNQLVSRRVVGYTPIYTDKLYVYEYVNESLINEYCENLKTRSLHIINGNLTKAELFFYNLDGTVLQSKKEILFSEYDNTPNLLKDFYFLNNLFYKSFSTNNYKKIEINKYNLIENTEDSIFSFSFEFNPNINEEGSLFEQVCE